MQSTNRTNSYRSGSANRSAAEKQKPPQARAQNDTQQVNKEIEKLKKELLQAHRENIKLKATIEFRDEEVKNQKQEIYHLKNENAMARRRL